MTCSHKELERAKRYRESNRTKINSRRREYYRKNIDEEKRKALPRAKEWYKNNVSRKSNYDKNYRRKLEIVCRNLYRSAKSRIKHQKGYAHRKMDIELDTFLEFAKKSNQLKSVYNNWKKNGYIRKLSPSLDRIDNCKGYSIENIQFLSMIENVNKYWKRDRHKT